MSVLRPGRCQPRTAGTVLLALLMMTGCGAGVKTHPVRGKVVFADGDIKNLLEQGVEFMKEDDPALRSFGEIGPDGTFEMSTLYKGKELRGVPEGTYKARILLQEMPEVDEDDIQEGRYPPLSQTIVNYRFLTFERSGLKFTVPGDSDITVKVSRR